jgi:hypothetical protein
MVGLALGAVIGIAVPELHHFKNKSVSLGMFSTQEATGLTLKWNPSIKKSQTHITL